jgi:hypothetical protein
MAGGRRRHPPARDGASRRRKQEPPPADQHSVRPGALLPMSMAVKGLDSYTRTGPRSATGPGHGTRRAERAILVAARLHLRAAPRKALMRLAAMVQRHSDALGADHHRIFQAIEDHADPPPTNGVPRALEYPCFTRLGWGELACPMYTRHTSRGKSAVESSERQPRTKECSALTGHIHVSI